jgi:acetyltransferase-like isoleucine patch superfamily enzyme
MIRRAVRWAHRNYRVRRDPVGYARSLGVTIGEGCLLLATDGSTWGSEPYLITIGDHVLITAGVRFATHDGAIWVYRESHPDIDRFGPITIESNVYIGTNAILLPGIRIGRDSVIGAGAVVNRDIPPRTIAAGVPARPICSIDDYWNKHIEHFTHIHRRPDAEKRATLLERFGKRGT